MMNEGFHSVKMLSIVAVTKAVIFEVFRVNFLSIGNCLVTFEYIIENKSLKIRMKNVPQF